MLNKIYIFILVLITIIVVSFIYIMSLPKKPNTIDKELSQQNQLNVDTTIKDIENSDTYYLHKSNLEVPEQNKCYIAQSIILKYLTDSEKKYIQEEIRIFT